MFFENRHGLKISVLVEGSGDELVFVMPGYGGFKSQPHIRTIVKAFVDNGFVAVSFDPTHSVGESDGEYEKATTTSYLEDLEDVINWAKDKIKDTYIKISDDFKKCEFKNNWKKN